MIGLYTDSLVDEHGDVMRMAISFSPVSVSVLVKLLATISMNQPRLYSFHSKFPLKIVMLLLLRKFPSSTVVGSSMLLLFSQHAQVTRTELGCTVSSAVLFGFECFSRWFAFCGRDMCVSHTVVAISSEVLSAAAEERN